MSVDIRSQIADWCLTAGVEWGPEQIEKRVSAVEAASGVLTVHGVLELARLVCEIPTRDPATLEGYHKALISADPSIRGEASHEQQLLAGCSIGLILRKSSAMADIGGLALVCADFGGRRPGERRRGFIDAARQYLISRGHELRHEAQTSAIPKLSSGFKLEVTTQALEKAGGSNEVAQLASATKEGFAAVHSGLSSLERLGSVVEALGQRLAVQSEAAEMLWWVFGEHTIEHGPVRMLGVAAASVICAYDLARLTVFVPGPLAAPALLDRMLTVAAGEPSGRVSLAQAVNASPRSWRDSFVQTHRSALADIETLCPTLLAMSRSSETPGATDWLPAFDHITGLRAVDELPAAEIAACAYYEHLLLRAVSSGRS